MAIPSVQKSVIEKAMVRFDQEFRTLPEWAQWQDNRAHKFAISANGTLYPAKKIVSLATSLPVKEFMGGVPTNGYLRARGFEIVDLRKSPKLEFVKGEIYDRRTEIHRPFGGSFQSGIAPSEQTKAIFLFAGTAGEQFGYLDEQGANGVYSYTGEGQLGDMTMSRGNSAIRDHAKTGRALHLFKSMGKGKGQKYVGEFACSSYTWENGLDREKTLRKILKFHLVPVGTVLSIEAFADDEESEVEPDAMVDLTLTVLRQNAFEAAEASEGAGSSSAVRMIYARSKKVREYVLLRAGGNCESCGKRAPFVTKANIPYLEPHHIDRLSDGGIDHPQYVGAVCPDCHREIHFGENGESKNEALRSVIQSKELIFSKTAG